MSDALKFPIEVVDDTEYINVNRLQFGDTTYKLPIIIEIPDDLNEDESIKYTVLKLCAYYGYTIDDLTDAKLDMKDDAIIDILEIDGYLIPSNISMRAVRPFKPNYRVYFNILKAMAKYHEWPTIFEVDKNDE